MIQIEDKRINLSDSEKIIGVVGDNLSNTLQFNINKNQENLDLSTLTLCALIERSQKDGSQSYSIPMTYECVSNTITTSLPITSYETKNYGYIYMSLKFSDSKPISLMSDYNNHIPGAIKVTCIGHGFAGTVSGVTIDGTTNYNGIYTITEIDADNFYFIGTWVSSQYGWCYVTPPTVWQTEKAMLIIKEGINGEKSSESIEPNIFAQQMASLEARCNQIISLFINLCTNSGWGSQTEPLIPLTLNLECNKSYFGVLGGIYELPIPEVNTIENIIHIYGYCDGTPIDLGTNFTYNQTTFSFESGSCYEIEYRYFPKIGMMDGHWGVTVVRTGEVT